MKTARGVVSDGLLFAMMFKGLPDGFRAFSTIATQKTADINFSDFKAYLRSYEKSEKCGVIHSNNERLMKLVPKNPQNDLKCFGCGSYERKKFSVQTEELK